MAQVVKPYNSHEGKKEQIAKMFNNIAFRYDFLNHFLSFNIDKIWRRKAIKIIAKLNPKQILDVATGTGDLAIAMLKKCNPEHIYGVDISEGMLEVGKQKLIKKGISQSISLALGDVENLMFDDNKFDAVTVAFGARNFENLDKGLSEMYRVTNAGGMCMILEFTTPQKFPIKQLFNFYFKKLLPAVGRLFSKDNSAYTYLPNSVESFAQRDELLTHLRDAGFVNVSYKMLSFGIAAIYVAHK